MSSANPIIPPGSPLQRNPSPVNSKLLVSVLAIVTVHVCLLTGLLIQGCQRQEPASPQPEGTTANPLPSLGASDTSPPKLASPPAEPAGVTPAPLPTSVPETVVAARPEPVPATPPVGGVGTAPGFSEVPTPAPAAPAELAPPAAHEMITYTVKAGDNLTRIARNHKTTVKALRAANKLSTDRILIGQKLKVPATDASVPAARPAEPASPPLVPR